MASLERRYFIHPLASEVHPERRPATGDVWIDRTDRNSRPGQVYDANVFLYGLDKANGGSGDLSRLTSLHRFGPIDIPVGATITGVELSAVAALGNGSPTSFFVAFLEHDETWNTDDPDYNWGYLNSRTGYPVDVFEPDGTTLISTVLLESDAPDLPPDYDSSGDRTNGETTLEGGIQGSPDIYGIYQQILVDENTGAGSRSAAFVQFNTRRRSPNVPDFNDDTNNEGETWIELWDTRVAAGPRGSLPNNENLIPNTKLGESLHIRVSEVDDTHNGFETWEFDPPVTLQDGQRYFVVVNHTPFPRTPTNGHGAAKQVAVRYHQNPPGFDGPLQAAAEPSGTWTKRHAGTGFGPGILGWEEDAPVILDDDDSISAADAFYVFNGAAGVLSGTTSGWTLGSIVTFAEGIGTPTATVTGLIALMQAWIDRAGYTPGGADEFLGVTFAPDTPGSSDRQDVVSQNTGHPNRPAPYAGLQLLVTYDTVGDSPQIDDLFAVEHALDTETSQDYGLEALTPATIVLSGETVVGLAVENLSPATFVLTNVQIQDIVQGLGPLFGQGLVLPILEGRATVAPVLQGTATITPLVEGVGDVIGD